MAACSIAVTDLEQDNDPVSGWSQLSESSERSTPGSPKFQIKATGEEARSYDFRSARPPGKKTNVIEATGHLIKSCLGGGVVAIHEGFKQCGLWTSLFLTICFGIYISYCMLTIARCAQKLYGRVQVPVMSYPDLAEATLMTGPFVKLRSYSTAFRYLLDFTISANLFGACCVYQVVIARTMKQLVENVEDISAPGGTSIRVYIAALLVPCVLICMITTLKYLAPFSIVADFFILTVTVSTVYYAITMAQRTLGEMPGFKDLPGLFEFMGVCVFSMEAIGAILPVENSMEEPRKIGLVLAGGMSCVISIVVTMGFFGYWGFGEKSKSPVTLNFPLSVYPIILKVFLGIMVYVTFALNFWFPFNLAWHYIKPRYDPAKYWLWERVYRAIFICIITIIAVAFPNVSKFIGVLGTLCVASMGFIYPAFIELCLDWEDPGFGTFKWRLWRFTANVTLGITLCILGTYSNVKELVKEVYG